MTAWQDAADTHILTPLRADPVCIGWWQKYVHAGRNPNVLTRLAQQGQLASAAELRAVLWSTFRYQRYHADAFVAVLKPTWFTSPCVILDIGCGAATAAIAVAEQTVTTNTPHVTYVGFDHNQHAITLGQSLIKDLAPGTELNTWHFEDDLQRAADRARNRLSQGDRLFVTFGHFFTQDTVTQPIVTDLARTVFDLAAMDPQKCARLIVVQPPRLSSQWPVFIGELRKLGASVECRDDAPTVTPRFPNLYPSTEGWYPHRQPRAVRTAHAKVQVP